MNFPSAILDILNGAAVQIAQRKARNTHAPSLCGKKKRLAKDFRRIANRNVFRVFVKRARQHRMPESLNSPRRLPMTHQPLRKVFFGVARGRAQKPQDAACNRNFVGKSQAFCA